MSTLNIAAALNKRRPPRHEQSPFRHSGYPHALIKSLAFEKKNRIVALWISTVALYGEIRIERQPRLHGRPRLIQFAEQRQGGSEEEVR